MGFLPVEFRLAAVVGVSAFVLAATYRFARRRTGGDVSSAVADTLLGFYLVQYLAVGITGLFGVLNAPVILAVATAMGAGLWFAAGRAPNSPPDPTPAPWVLRGGFVLVLSYLAALAWVQRPIPPVANDPLTYHLPAAVYWIQHGRLTLYETWLYNPANTYSPLAGSVFLVWLLAPMGNDVLVHSAQAPALVLVFLSVVGVCRGLGGRPAVAAVVATAVALSRPLLSQASLEKDDLFVAAFFAAAFAGLTPQRLRDPLGPWRVGAAVGLLLATKYTALLSLPLLLLALDAPARAGWRPRQWAVAFALPVLLAGPWYLRNAVAYGNPLYPLDLPLLPGLLATARSETLRSLGGVWWTLAKGYYSLPAPLWAAAAVAWVGAVLRFGAASLRSPLARILVFGPVVGLGLFLLLSPYDELRFAYPSLILLMACAGVAFGRWPPGADAGAAAVVLILSLAANFDPAPLVRILPVVAPVAAVGMALAGGWAFLPRRSARVGLAAVVALAAAGWVFVDFKAFVAERRESAERPEPPDAPGSSVWTGYGPLADAWAFARRELPPADTLAYANTVYVYPLYGFDLRRPVVYAPVKAGVAHVRDLPRLPGKLPGEAVIPAVVRATTDPPDRAAWVNNLHAAGAKYLFVAKADLTHSPTPPAELGFADADPIHFERVFENPSAVIYRLRH